MRSMQSHNIKIVLKIFQTVAEFKYWGVTVTNREEIKKNDYVRGLHTTIQCRKLHFLFRCLLSNGYSIQNYNFTSSFVCVLNMVSNITVRKGYLVEYLNQIGRN
jgi:hypothetical protein